MRKLLFIFLCLTSLWASSQDDTLVRPLEPAVEPVDTSARVAPPQRTPRPATPRPRPRPVVRDTVRVDTLTTITDTLSVLPAEPIITPPAPPRFYKRFDSLIYTKHPVIHFRNPVRRLVSEYRWEGKEAFFYTTVGLLIFFSLIRNGFNRYLNDLFSLFLRTSLKQRQIKEQLMQAPLPSLLLNILFFISGALFLSLIFRHYNLGDQFAFWQLILYCGLGLMSIYLVKFISLKVIGWTFRVPEATDAYTFIVFTANKILGMALLPFVVLLAFTTGVTTDIAITVSFILIGGIFVYRYYLAYSSIHRQIRLGFIHFLLYLAAFEVAPLLLINKLLFHFLA